MRTSVSRTQKTILTVSEAKRLIDTYITNVLDIRADSASTVHPHYERLWHSIKSVYAAGGKRLRPYMTLLMYQAYGGDDIEAVLPAASAQELIHQAMLAHDDIIDRDSIRYGVKNISGQYLDEYAPHADGPSEGRHFADAAAILAGDLLISEAYAQLAQSDVPTEMLHRAQSRLNEAVFHVAGGELLDTEASFYQEGAITPLTIAEQKTASYSFVGPLTMGAVLGGASDEQIGILKHLGTSVGIAYQLRDDLIGVFGDSTVTGKSTDGDIREGKRTLLIEEFLKRADDEQRARFNAIFGNPHASNGEIDEVRNLLTQTGAREAIEGFIETYKVQTTEHLAALDISAAHRDVLAQLIETSLKRDY
jgi:geranylgeranyl pyrophosphate synthase